MRSPPLPPPLPAPPPAQPQVAPLPVPCRREQCDVVAASIYVNPTQFSANEDFGVYPRSEASGAAWVCIRAAAEAIGP